MNSRFSNFDFSKVNNLLKQKSKNFFGLEKKKGNTMKTHQYTIVVFRKHLALRKNKFLIGHRWLPHFSEHTGQAECVRVQSKTPIKLNRSKKPSNRIVRGKSGTEKTSTNTFVSGNSGFLNKQKVYR